MIRGSAYRIPAKAMERLAEDPEVQYITPDRTLNATLDYSTAAVNTATAWQYGLNGSGIAVAVIDSGIANHPDLKNSAGALRVVYSHDFIGGGTDDHYGHGEHVAGIIASDGYSSTGSIDFRTFKGMAPAANVVNLRVLDQNGQGTDSGVISAINTAISLKNQYNIRVINLSLGRPVYESYTLDPLCQAVEAAWKAGIVVVVAAGNEGRNNSDGTHGYATIMAPGNDPYVITVGAMKTMGTYSRSDDLIAGYSSKGPTLIDHIVKPDLVAPGNRVVSLRASTATLPSQYPKNSISLTYYQNTGSGALSNEYYTLSGTSMAAPVVSGAAVLLLQQNPSLTPDQLKARLMKTAYKAFPASSVAVDPVMVAKLQAIKLELRRRKHEPIAHVGEWLRKVTSGYYLYHAVPGNLHRLEVFRHRLGRLWRLVLQQRSQRGHVSWEHMHQLLARWVPAPSVLHPHPRERFDASHPRWKPYA